MQIAHKMSSLSAVSLPLLQSLKQQNMHVLRGFSHGVILPREQ